MESVMKNWKGFLLIGGLILANAYVKFCNNDVKKLEYKVDSINEVLDSLKKEYNIDTNYSKFLDSLKNLEEKLKNID